MKSNKPMTKKLPPPKHPPRKRKRIDEENPRRIDEEVNAKSGTIKLIPGDATLTRRILKRCRERGFKVEDEGEAVRIGGGRWGFRRDAYIVPTDIFEEEVAHRSAEQVQAEEQERERLAQRARRLAKLTAKFPKLDVAAIELALERGDRLYLPEEMGYQFGRGTKSYWDQLGYRVEGQACGIVVRGTRRNPVYSRHHLVEKRSQVTVEQLLEKWRQRHGSDEIVLAEAIRFANRLQKVKKHGDFYPLKDLWIKRHQRNLVEGRISRIETKVCWNCDGAGCWRCDDGIYSSRTLYEHVFEIRGRTYTFHSYVRPTQVSEAPGADLANYGRPFTPDELPLPPQSLLVGLAKLLLCQDENGDSQPHRRMPSDFSP